VRRGELAIFFAGRKYRTSQVRRQQNIAIAGAGLLITLTSAFFVSASLHTAKAGTTYKRGQIYLIGSSQIPAMAPLDPHGIWLTGDSVILGIRAALAANHPLALVNARVGRQIGELINVVSQDQPKVAKQTVVLDLGNNNRLVNSDVKKLFDLLARQPKVIVVDAAVPRAWQDENNALIKSVAANYPNFTVIDWAAISAGHPEYFAADGVHLNEKGGQVYVAAILEHL
jgi:hypothetical protein